MPFTEKIKRLFRRHVCGEPLLNFLGMGTINFIDVGSVGELPDPWYAQSYRINRLLKFEPRETSASRCNSIITRDVALWSENCTREFYIYKSGTGSSLLQQNVEYVRDHYDELSQRGRPDLAKTWFERSALERVQKIECRTLDGVISDLDDEVDFHFIKIDAQGAESEILKGASRTLNSCLGLHLELFKIPLYKDVMLLDQVADWLHERGFELVKKFPAHGSFDSQHDCVFLRRGSQPLIDQIVQIYGFGDDILP